MPLVPESSMRIFTRRRLRWSEDAEPGGEQRIDHAGSERGLRPDHHELGPCRPRRRDHRPWIERVDRRQAAHPRLRADRYLVPVILTPAAGSATPQALALRIRFSAAIANNVVARRGGAGASWSPMAWPASQRADWPARARRGQAGLSHRQAPCSKSK